MNNLTFLAICDKCITTPVKERALRASGTLNPHPEGVRSDLFKMDFFDPYDRAQVKYEMLRAHAVDENPVAEACRQFGFSRESFYQIQQAFQQLGFSSFLPGKRGRKGPVKLKGAVLEFALAQQKRTPISTPVAWQLWSGSVTASPSIGQPCCGGRKKNGTCRAKGRRETFVAHDDLVQALYENVRGEALQNLEPASWALERVRRYGVASLCPGAQEDFPFILYAQSIPRPAWNGKRDFHRERLLQVYEFLTQEVTENASRHLCPDCLRYPEAELCPGVAVRSLESPCGPEGDGHRRGVYGW
jgi:Helix-turn-helix domain